MRFLLVVLILISVATKANAQENDSSRAIEVPFTPQIPSITGSMPLAFVGPMPRMDFKLTKVDLFNKDDSNDIDMVAVMQRIEHKRAKPIELNPFAANKETKGKSIITVEVKPYNSTNYDLENSALREGRRGIYVPRYRPVWVNY